RLEKLGTTATLANEWKLKTVMVNGDRRIEILGFNFYNETALKNAGAFIEMEGLSKRRFFIPMGNTDVMKRIMDISPVARIKARDILGDAADVINADIPEGVGENLNFIHPWFAAKAEAMENPLMDVAEGAMNVSSDPEVNERARASEEGVKPLSGWDEVKHAVRQFVHGFSGDYPELAVQESESGVDLKPARELIRKMNREIQAQTQKAVKLLDGLLKPMSARGYDTFRWAWIMMDLKYQKSDMPDSLLPYGWTDEQFEKDFNKWMERAEKMPNVKQAIERMEEITADMAGNLASAFHAIGWHSAANRFRNPHYFHHVVLEFANVLASTQGKHNHGKAPDNRSWLKRRKGSDKDISANFIQVTGEYLTQAFQDIASCKMLKEIKDKYDIIEQVKREAFMTNEGNVIKQIYEGMKKVDKFTLEHPTDEQMWADAESLFRKTFNQKQAKALSRLFELAKRGDLPEGEFGDVVDAMEAAGSVEDLPETMRKRFNRYLGWLAGLGGDDAGTLSARGYFKGVADKKKQIKATLGDEFLDWRDLVPEGYTVWDPFNNPLVISVNTVPEYIMKLAEQENLQDIHIALADLVKMKVIGGHRQLWVIPTEIAATLDRLGKRKPRGKGGVVARRISSLWKKNVLYNPWRVLKSNLRNFTSDLDAAVAGNPKILAYLPRAVKELTDLFFRGRAATGDLRDFQERGGALTAESVQELYDWKNMREFKHLAPKEQEKLLKRMAHIGSGYMEWAETVTQWRESWLRYAAYLHYMEDMRKNGGIPTSWGASKPEEVMALKDIRDRAYKMANELLGAYDQVSQTTRGMREWVIPFMSWKEVNFRRVLQMFRNTAQGRSWIEAEVRTILGGGGGKGPNDPTGGKAAFDGGDDRFHWTSLLGFAMRTPTIALRMAMTLATNFWF
ncbi:MAG: hypothetical protein IJR68_07415, partial [Fretibacterium sp.]|nr:hypothetical protein [Fretibacterium sp.]